MRGNLWTLVVIALVLALALPAVNIGFANAAQPGDSLENTTVDYDQNYTLEDNDVYEYTSLTVTANGTQLSEGTDYTFDADNGTIDWLDTLATTDGDDATVEYDYTDHDETTSNQRRLLQTIATPVGFLAMLIAFGYLLVLIFRDPY